MRYEHRIVTYLRQKQTSNVMKLSHKQRRRINKKRRTRSESYEAYR